MTIDGIDYGQPHTELSWADMARVPAGNHTFISWADTHRLLSAPSGHRPRIYAYAERGDYAGQILSLKSHYDMERYGDDLGFVWLSGNTIADLISAA